MHKYFYLCLPRIIVNYANAIIQWYNSWGGLGCLVPSFINGRPGGRVGLPGPDFSPRPPPIKTVGGQIIDKRVEQNQSFYVFHKF